MKFGRTFRNALEADRYPRHWVEKAITYRQLKKILGKVREELLRNGYDPDTLHRLRASHHAEYRLEPDGSRLLRPKLVVRPGRRTGGPSSLEHATAARPSADSPSPAPDSADGGAPGSRDSNNSNGRDKPDDDGWVMIPLRSDAKFFSVLQSDVSELDSLQEEERQSMHAKIRDLGTEISALARPRRGFVRLSKSDLYRWREIFELYLAAEVFFSTSEASGGPRDSETAQKQLIWFQEEVNKRQLPQHFKIEASAVAYSQFLALNATLLHNLRFQELNQTAVTKIIKSRWMTDSLEKSPSLPAFPPLIFVPFPSVFPSPSILNLPSEFDKRTSLGVKAAFPKVMYSAQFISESISKDICAQLSREVVSIVPQIVDYTCTVCKYRLFWALPGSGGGGGGPRGGFGDQ